MAGQTLLWDSRIRTVVVMLPALGVMAWIASAFASEEFLVPGIVLGVFCVLVMFTVFVKNIRFETAVLCALLFGYLVGNRGFAELTPVKPLFPGELGMVAILACILVRFALTRELPDFSGWVARVIFIYCGLGAVRLALDYNTYRLDAVRDSAMVYYSVYFFFGRQLVARPETKVILERCLKYAFLALVPIALLERFLPDFAGFDSGGNFGVIYQKDDLMTTFAAAGVFILYTRPKIFRWNWIRVTMIFLFILLVVSGIGRASLAALIIGSVLMFVAGKTKFFLYPAIAVILGVTVLASFVIGFNGRNSSAMVLVDKVTSMVDVTGTSNYSSDFGKLKSGTNDFRRKLWATFTEETNEYDPWFGHGFGYNFVLSFSEIYRLTEAGGLRSAHNFYVTLFGRMGWIGIAVFAALTVQIVVGGLRTALAVKAGTQVLSDLGYWCTIWVILVSSVVGVVLEGPVAAIVFWTLLGVAVDSTRLAAVAHREQVRKQHLLDFPPIPILPEPRPARYGMA